MPLPIIGRNLCHVLRPDHEKVLRAFLLCGLREVETSSKDNSLVDNHDFVVSDLVGCVDVRRSARLSKASTKETST
jgi:hypothetical protein